MESGRSRWWVHATFPNVFFAIFYGRQAGEASVVRVARDERSQQWPTGTDHHARFFGARTIPRGSSLVGREV